MAKLVVDFGIAGLVIGDLTWTACKKASDNSDVSTAGSTLTAFDSAGKYWLENPNVTEDTLFAIYPTATPAALRLGTFRSPNSLDVCNEAALALGGKPMQSFNDGSTTAVLCSAAWTRAIEMLLRLHPWNCAIKRAVLTPDADPPVYGWTAAFSLPSDLLRLLEIDGVTEYKIEGRKILCDESELNIRYVYLNTDPATWDALLLQSMTAYMQFRLAYPLTKAGSVEQGRWAQFAEILRSAKAIDAQEEPGDTLGDSPFLNVRG